MNNVEEYKNQIDLNEIVKLFGYKFIREKSSKQSKQYRGDQWNKIVVMRKDGKYFYFDIQNKDNKGSIIDFLINHGVKNINEAINWCKDYVESGDYTIPEPEEPELKSETQLDKIWTSIKNINPIPKIRGIKPDIWQHAIEAKNLKIDKDLNIYLALVNLKGLCGIEVRNGSEKRLIKDSTKGIWWYGEKINKTKMIVVCESGIDALSYIQLHGDNGETTYIATIGQYGQLTKEIITAIINTNKQTNWIIATDNDQAGDKMAEQIMADIKEINNTATIKRERSKNKDWNDDLNAKNKEINMSEIEQVIETFGGEVVEEKRLVAEEAEMQEKETPAVDKQAIDNGSSGNDKASGEENQATIIDKYEKTITYIAAPPIDILEKFRHKPPDYDFIWPGFLSGTIGALIGQSSIGKSYWSLEAAMAVVAGPKADLLGLGNINTGKVVYLSAEDGEISLSHRLYDIAQSLDEETQVLVAERLIIEPIAGVGFDLINDYYIDRIIKKCKDTRLIIIDTLSTAHLLDENNNSNMVLLINTLNKMIKETGSAILYVHHASKFAVINGQIEYQTAARGASVLINNIRWSGYLAGMTDKEADKYDKPNKKEYVKYGISKQSYSNYQDEIWYHREENGVLKPTDLQEKSADKPISKKGVDNNGRTEDDEYADY